MHKHTVFGVFFTSAISRFSRHRDGDGASGLTPPLPLPRAQPDVDSGKPEPADIERACIKQIISDRRGQYQPWLSVNGQNLPPRGK